MDQALTIGGELSPSPPLSMVVAVHHSTRPTMSMLGDHQVHGGLQQLVRRRKEETPPANQPNAKSGIYTMAAATADAGEQNAAVPGRDQGGRKFGGPDKKEDEYDKLKLNTEDSEVEARTPGWMQEEPRNWWPEKEIQEKPRNWWTDNWFSNKIFRGEEDQQGDQWNEITDSPLKRLVRSPFGWVPKFNLMGGGRQRGDAPKAASTTKIKGRGRGRGAKKDKKKKKGDLAIQFAKKAATDPTLVKELENKFCAASSKGSKSSKAKLVESILQAIENSRMAYPLTVKSLKMLAATLHRAGYASAEQYLGEAKLQHVELGFRWTEQLHEEMQGGSDERKGAEEESARAATEQVLEYGGVTRPTRNSGEGCQGVVPLRNSVDVEVRGAADANSGRFSRKPAKTPPRSPKMPPKSPKIPHDPCKILPKPPKTLQPRQ